MRSLLISLSLFVAVLACPSRLRAQSISIDSSSILVVKAFAAAWHARDSEALLRLLDERVSMFSAGRDSVVVVRARGKAQLRAVFEASFKEEEKETVTARSITAVGPWTAAHMSFEKKSANGSTDMMWLFVFEIRGGLIERFWVYPAWMSSSYRAPGAERDDAADASFR